MPKADKAAAEGVFFREQLGKLDWSDLRTPPALLDAGVVGGRRGQRVDEAPRDDAAGRSSSPPQMRASGLEKGRSVGGEDWGWGEGVFVGVVGGVLASACVVVLAGAIRRGMRGDRSYEDISDGGSGW